MLSLIVLFFLTSVFWSKCVTNLQLMKQEKNENIILLGLLFIFKILISIEEIILEET